MLTLWLQIVLCFCHAESEKILGFSMFPSVSHQAIFQPLWKELSLRGHELTVITPNPLKDPSLTNLTEIDVSHAYEVLSTKDFSGNMAQNEPSISKLFFTEEMATTIMEAEIQHADVQKLLEYDENHFELIILQSLHPLVYFFGAKFKAPIVGKLSSGVFITMFTLCLQIVLCVCHAESAKILGFFMFPSVSHQVIFQPIWKELSLRGHEVTVVTPNPLKDPSLTNLTEIDVSRAYEVLSKQDFSGNMAQSNDIAKVQFVQKMLMTITEAEIQHADVQKLLEYDENHFDLLLVQSLHPLVYFYGAKFKAPIVGVSSFALFLNMLDAAGSPTHPIVAPETSFLGIEGELSFTDKVRSLLFNFWYRILYYWKFLPEADRVARKYLGKDMPYLGDVISNTSIFLVNGNSVLHTIKPNVPSVISISQMHIKKRKPLPKDLQEYMNSSPEGVVYFSLGSNVKSVNLTTRTRKVIIGALGELPYKVLWKWESDYLPDCPKNVMTKKWLPQQDILAHPNVKVFITQGGLQSMEEAITYGVPIVGIPFISDQNSNIDKAVQKGIGLGLKHATMTKDMLKSTILEVAKNKSYKEHIQKARAILTDHPLQGVDNAIWWIEYVIRHKGATHLRSPSADMSFFEYFMIDVVLFLLFCSVLSIYSVKILLRRLLDEMLAKIKVN
ncbi:hypothetical protein JTB14_036486 [Gonioctena quinquepunctata]|nr:hypothetical protein JTB14_036486 [Gonioctena quinquepunctata]